MSKLGSAATAEDTPETRRISAHLRALHKLVAETKASYLALKREMAGTPENLITLGQKGELARLESKVHRLQNGFAYWQRMLDDARRRARLPAALQDPKAAETLDRTWPIGAPDPWPEGGGGGHHPLPPRAPAPPAVGNLTPDRDMERICGMPPGLKGIARERWIEVNVIDAWDDYLREGARATSDYDRAIQKWHIDLYYWHQRRKKSEAAGIPFTEKQPAQPTAWVPQPPKCRPGGGPI